MSRKNAASAPKQKNIIFRLLGPGLVTGAADDDPSGIATYSQAGAQFGYGLLWTVFLTTPFMIAIQLVSAHIGRVTGKGIAANAKQFYPLPLVLIPVGLLVVANTINIAADLAAMGEALYLVIGGLKHEHALIFAASSVLLQVFVPYHRYAPVLKCLTLVLFFYVAVAFTIEIPWRQVLAGTVLPTISLNHDYLLLVVAVLGTTISPYLFFWQASQEVEEMQSERSRPRLPLKILTRGGGSELTRMTVDTTIGMLFSNIIAYCIIVATASTLHAHGITQIQTAAQAAEALRPIAGGLAFLHRSTCNSGARRICRLCSSRSFRMAFHLGGQVSGSDWLLRDYPRCDDHRIRDGILAHQSYSAACLDRCRQRNRRHPHHGGDDADRDQSQGDGPFSGAPNSCVGRLGRNGFDGRHCRRIIVVATALGSTTS
jgi:NRAMP (natural resistance-associated macrophage protein)-like metal ion transporter